MSSKLNTAFSSISDLKLWFRQNNGEDLKLSDVPELISLRWTYFRDNWEFIRSGVLDKKASYSFPDMLVTQVENLTSFIDRQKSAQNQKINPFASSKVLSKYYAVWDNIQVSSIPVSREEQDIIDERTRRVNRFTRSDFENIRNNIVAARDELSDNIGLSDDDYNRANNRSSTRQLRDPGLDDIRLMQTLQSAITNVDFVLANSGSLETTAVDPFALARENAENPDIEIIDGKSGRFVKMNFGDSLQDLAARYLGDPSRWLDIAIANGLKPPYIDEVGEAIPLIVNGDQNQINISAVDSEGNRNINKFFINQIVFLSSNTVKETDQRKIVNIQEVPVSGNIVLELDGETDLGKYTVSDNAFIRVFKPNTVNSNFLVMVPTEIPIDDAGGDGKTPFFLESKSEDEKKAGVDISVNDTADLVFTPNNDLQLSFGLANALQAMKLKMVSERGQNPLHPNFGLPQVVGRKAKDPDQLKQTLITGINDMISADPRFDRIEQLDVQFSRGNQFNIGLVVRLAGTGTLVPISFAVNTG